jgi:hypothetical protein
MEVQFAENNFYFTIHSYCLRYILAFLESRLRVLPYGDLAGDL